VSTGLLWRGPLGTRVERITAAIKNIKGFGHLKRTAVEIKQYVRTNYKTDDYFMPAMNG